MKFSERAGLTPPKPIMDIHTIDDELRNRVWNVIYTFFITDLFDETIFIEVSPTPILWKIYGALGLKTKELETNNTRAIDIFEIKYIYQNGLEFYNLVECVAKTIEDDPLAKEYPITDNFNAAFEIAKAPVRFINGQLMLITNEQEIQELSNAGTHEISAVQKQIKSAIAHYSNREAPNYKNTITEAISALESLLTNLEPSAKTMGDAIKALKKDDKIDGAMLAMLEKLYGYASQEGIRHGEKAVDSKSIANEPEARFMLILCSACINYLTQISNKT